MSTTDPLADILARIQAGQTLADQNDQLLGQIDTGVASVRVRIGALGAEAGRLSALLKTLQPAANDPGKTVDLSPIAGGLDTLATRLVTEHNRLQTISDAMNALGSAPEDPATTDTPPAATEPPTTPPAGGAPDTTTPPDTTPTTPPDTAPPADTAPSADTAPPADTTATDSSPP